MRTLSLSNCLLDHASGSGRTRLAWSEGLRSLGHDVTTVESVELLGGSEGSPKGRRVRIAWGAWQFLRRQDLSRVDLIEFYGAEFWLATSLLVRRPGPRPLLVAHTDGLEMLAQARLRTMRPDAREQPRINWREHTERVARSLVAGWRDHLEERAFSRVDGFVTASEADTRYLREHGIRDHRTMEVVPLGLEPAYLDLPVEGGGPREERVVFMGSWIRRKGIGPLVAVMVPLLRERPALRLELYGVDLADANPSRDFPAELTERITVHPRLPIGRIIAGLRKAKVFFFPSEYEGFGLALAEAMACGCAAVTTPTGLGANLRDGQEALACPFGDTEAMGRAIRALLDNEDWRARVARAGHARVQELRWATSVRQLESIYLRWLENAAPAPRTAVPLASARGGGGGVAKEPGIS